MLGPSDRLRGNNPGLPKTERGCCHLHSETNAKAGKTMGLSTWCLISSCGTYPWLLTARCQVTFPSRVTTASSLLLHPVTERTFVSRQSPPQQFLFHFYSHIVGLTLIIPYRKWELINEANSGIPSAVTKMSRNKKGSQNKSDLRSTKTPLYFKLHCYRKKQYSIILLSCLCIRLHYVIFFIQNVCLTSNILFLIQLQEMPNAKIFEVT